VKKSLSIRTHICTKCGTILDRDYNASRNILQKGLEELLATN
ncbi:transposase, partial [Bacillus cytotoxicus]|nr:transposase [Bacillus cytotoxicus]